MALPSVTPSVTQDTDVYTIADLTSLTSPLSEELANAIATVATPVVTQDATTLVITVAVKITFQAYVNGGISKVVISQAPEANVFRNPIELLTINHTTGLRIYNVTQKYAAGTTGDFTLTISGDNVSSVTPITNPF